MALSQPDPPGVLMQHSTDPRRHDNAAELERGAYNQAFSELGLKSCSGDKDCVQAYIERHHPHLLQAYDSGFLAAAIESVRRRLSGAVPH